MQGPGGKLTNAQSHQNDYLHIKETSWINNQDNEMITVTNYLALFANKLFINNKGQTAPNLSMVWIPNKSTLTFLALSPIALVQPSKPEKQTYNIPAKYKTQILS